MEKNYKVGDKIIINGNIYKIDFLVKEKNKIKRIDYILVFNI